MTTGPVHIRFAQPETMAGTVLERDRVVPAVVLRDSSGDDVRPTVFRQHRALVLAFLHSECPDCTRFAEDVASRLREFTAVGSEVRVVLDRPARTPVPVWVDEDGRARQAFLGSEGAVPTVVALDRYAAAQAAYPASDHDFPDVGELIAELDWLAVQCPECST